MIIELDELAPQEAATLLNAAFDASGITFTDKAASLAAFKEGHHIIVGDDGTLQTHYSGQRTPLHLALGQWGRTSEGEGHTDRRSLPKDEQNPGSVRSKADLKTPKAKSAFIAKFGFESFSKLPTSYVAPEETKFQDEYSKLTVAQKSELAAKGITITSFPVRPNGQIKGSFIAHDKLAKEKAIRRGR